MWSTEKAQSVMKQLMNYVDLCIANDEDFESSLGMVMLLTEIYITVSMRLMTISGEC